MSSPRTLYQIADAEIRRCIDVYLELATASNGLTAICPTHLADERAKVIVMMGFGLTPRAATAEEVCTEWQRRQALPFDLETVITAGVYSNLRAVGDEFFDELSVATGGFSRFDPDHLTENPHFLPLLQHLSGIFGKAKLKEHIGVVSDNRISQPAAERLAKFLSERVNPANVNKDAILKLVFDSRKIKPVGSQ